MCLAIQEHLTSSGSEPTRTTGKVSCRFELVTRTESSRRPEDFHAMFALGGFFLERKLSIFANGTIPLYERAASLA
jgi:hypothetical protein